MKKISFIIFLVLILPLKLYSTEENKILRLYLGETKIISAKNPIRIIIGNPEIVDVTHVTKDEITLAPKGVGKTNFILWDDLGEHSYEITVVSADLEEIKQRIDNLLKRLNLTEVYTHIEEKEDKVLLMGRVKTLQDKERLSLALGKMKERTIDLIVVREEEAMVEIDVQVLELSKDATKTLGLTWPASITLTDVSGPTITPTTGLKEIFRISDFTRTAFNVTLDALVAEGKARILSRPRITCQSGKEAELLVGGEKPIFTPRIVEGRVEGVEVEYKEYGIKLKIKPTVLEREYIKLSLDIEVSEPGEVEAVGPPAAPIARAYPFFKRTTSTELILRDGQIMAIGGLLKEKAEEEIRKTPFLGDIPIVGLLFRRKITRIGGGVGERGEMELFITLTPTVIREEREIEIPITEVLPQYIKEIHNLISKNLHYPALAREEGIQGSVKLSLRLSRSGELLDLKIKESSGYEILDKEVVSTAKRVFYPPFPSSIKERELSIDIPVVYQLD